MRRIAVLTATLLLCLTLLPPEAAPQVIAQGNTARKEIALTFDDGPRPGSTDAILDILKERDVDATFFVVGKMAAVAPDTLRRIRDEGHTIANHTHHHYDLTELPIENVHLEWRMCSHTIRAITGEMPRFCRPPGGRYNRRTLEEAEREGLATVLWTINGADVDVTDPNVVIRRVVRNVSRGDIVLLHNGSEATLEALPELIRRLRNRGYRFVTLDDIAPRVAGSP
ncbi:MAG: polysaccharide deacetylase family protein [Synergistales bacterium]|nr:polysaccharide deacetylase family protein [Synergistales bacterium]